MFLPERWAAAFFGAAPSPEAAEEGLAAFKALLPPVENLRGEVAGAAQAIRLEGMIRAAAAETGFRSPGLEGAIRLITLLVKKNRLAYGGRVAEGIEKLLNEKKGIVEVVLETAVPPEAEFGEALKKALIKKTGAGEIRVLPRVLPELLGGCRLRIGGRSIDASLRGQLAKMAADLGAAGGT
ncbi:MAG: F0F1 ATP synthase subunit delta [Treponema sp.]|jgi:F-type H+-transporting ATPase subunit delta|nr:F0F1 ATP synthase subunit delta [Treponema sp.]